MTKTPTTLIIMDGFGIAPAADDNAISLANTPVLDRLMREYAHTTLSASGLDVGLPEGQMGNSEVGHTNIGGGRVVFQDLPRISLAIKDGSFFKNPAYNMAMDECLKRGTALHLYGLLSDGGVHSHIEHLYALLQMAKDKGLQRVYVHCFLDGRDVSPTSGKGFVEALRDHCAALGVGKIATVMGRYYAMDRDKRWERLQMAYDAMVYGEGIQNPDPVDAVAQSYAAGVTDEFMEPVVCDSQGTISDHDSVIFFNFRPDRAREITRAIVDEAFDGFQREYFPTTYVCNTEYDAAMPNVTVLAMPCGGMAVAGSTRMQSTTLEMTVAAAALEAALGGASAAEYAEGFRKLTDSLNAPDPQRNIARHAETLTYSQLMQAAWRLLKDDGELSVVVPFDYRQRMEDEAIFVGFFPSRVCAVRTAAHKAPKRFLLAFRKHPCNCEKTEMTIGDETYNLLTQDFYLY